MLSPIETVAAHPSPACGQEKLGHNLSLPGSIPEYLTLSPRVTLVTSSIVCAARGVNAEEVIAMVDNAIHPRHIRFAFNVAKGRAIREFRFWRDEIVAPAFVKNFTVRDAIARILGGRPAIRRSELEVSWQISSNTLTNLIRLNILKGDHGRFSRATLEAFLLSRWSEACPN